jgi:16S rRNA (cytosine967-C5)-methyltransferase
VKRLAEPSRIRSHAAATPGVAARVDAARVLCAVRDGGRSLPDAIDSLPSRGGDRDAALVQELAYGSVRTLARLNALTDILLRRPLKREDSDLLALIQIGLYQILATRIPDHAAVDATVEAARRIGKGWAAPLINAILRRFLRERALLLGRIDASEEAKWLFPVWLLRRIQSAWPEHWTSIIDASNERPPMTLRVNAIKTTRARYLESLAVAGLTARPAAHARDGLVLDLPLPARRLPGFDQGMVSVQDAGAQLAAELLGAQPGERVLDACAAPGGKTTHMLERAGNALDLTALDLNSQRLERVRENLDRLGLSARVVAGDATAPDGEWARDRYDRILLDAPCSATGVIRRHPDIKQLRRPTDIAALGAGQTRMLDALWPLLSPGGRLVYATCSLLPQENEAQVAAFLDRHPDAREVPLACSWGLPRDHGRQTLPGMDGMDGFYYATLEKAAT